MTKAQSNAPRVNRRRLITVAVIAYLALACVMGAARPDGAQFWWEEKGPVVPHDTFPLDCSECHVGGSWTEIREDFEFDHAAETGVALEGAHSEAACLRCHNDRGPVDLYAARGCAGCHEDRHEGRLGDNCQDCHGQSDWKVRGALAQHSQTRFPLVGAHAAAACWRCHPAAQQGIFDRASVQCIVCHRDDLQEAVDPPHIQLGWTDDCQRCHIPIGWSGRGFTHSSFPLTGAHAQADCEACHQAGQFTGLPRDCVGCHLVEYQNTIDPPHVSQGFPQMCELCHTTQAWTPATFNHAGIVDSCVTCHLDDYQATSNPNHQASGFPLSCEGCHSTQTWFGATFNHTFNINSGDHSQLDCTDCHLSPGVFPDFSCIHCHEHNQNETDDEHDDVNGYVWESNACFACHPTGND